MATSNGKDVIYIDVDDEITGIIDKVTSAHEKIVALVLPKRAAVFQSVVNMKLLKRRAESAQKHLVLITSESALMPLAGNVGLYVAKTLQSKPEIPAAPAAAAELEDDDEAVPVNGEDFDAKSAGEKPVGELAGGAAAAGALNAAQMPEETIELDNTDAEPPLPSDGDKNVNALAAGGAAGKAGKHGKGKNKKLKVPNFNRFRMLLVFGGLALVILIVVFIVANKVLPKASITIQTVTSSVNSSLTPTLDTTATTVDGSTQVVPARAEQVQKTYTKQVPATGKQNNGDKATGTVAMIAKECGSAILQGAPPDVPPGSGVSANGLTFITQEVTSFNASGNFSNGCVTYLSTSPTAVTAQNGGSQYNLGNNSNFSAAGRPDVSGTGSTSGGTDSIQTVVQQSDIDSAKQLVTASVDKNAIKSQLQQQLQNDGEYPLPATFNAGAPTVSSSANAGAQADNVTVTESVTYTMFGAKQSDLQKLIASNVDQQIDPSKQTIQDYGLSSADISVPNTGSGTKLQINMQVTSVVGPHLNQAQVKTTIEGKKSGDAQDTIKQNPGVQTVTVKLSPFWVGSVPKNPAKITITLEKSSSGNGGQ